MTKSTQFQDFIERFFPSILFSKEQKELISYVEQVQPCFLDEEKTRGSKDVLYYYVIYRLACSYSPQTVIILTKNNFKDSVIKDFDELIKSANFSNMTKVNTSVNFVDSHILTLNSKIIVKSSIQSLIGMKADLIIVGEEFEDQFHDFISNIHAREIIFKFPKPEEKIESIDFFEISKEKSFSLGLFEDISKIISKIGRTNLSEIIFFILEERGCRKDRFFEHDLHFFFQRLEMMESLDDLYIRKRTTLLFENYFIYDIAICFEKLFPSWDDYLVSQNIHLRNRSLESFVLESYLLSMKIYVERNSMTSFVNLSNEIHTQCQVAFNKVFFANLDRIINELEKAE